MTDPTTDAQHPPAASDRGPSTRPTRRAADPWPALWALVIGFFMILVDTTIVSVANPAIKAALDPTRPTSTTSCGSPRLPARLRRSAADHRPPRRPLRPEEHLPHRPRGLHPRLARLRPSSSLEMLIAARAVQGLGAALMTPQTMAVITRTFPPSAAVRPWGCGARPPVSRPSSARCSAACSSTASAGSGSSSSTSPSGSSASCSRGSSCRGSRRTRTSSTSSASSSARSACSSSCSVCRRARSYDWGVIWGPISVWALIIAGVARARASSSGRRRGPRASRSCRSSSSATATSRSRTSRSRPSASP